MNGHAEVNVSEPTILYDIRDGIARITLNRPDRLNSFTAAMHGELRGNIEHRYYEAGHMMYVHEPSRLQQSKDLAAFVTRSSPAR